MAVLHGAAENTTPEKQGMWAMFEVFFDTIVICSLTGLVILCVCHRVGSLVLSGAADGVLSGDTDFWPGDMDGLVSGSVSGSGFCWLYLSSGRGLDGI